MTAWTERDSEELRRLVHRAGGVVSRTEIARLYGVTRQAVQKWSDEPDFPAPIIKGRWATVEVIAWVGPDWKHPKHH